MLAYMLDTNICIFLLKGGNSALEEQIMRHDGELAISSIVLFELQTGVMKSAAREKNQRKLNALLNLVHVEIFCKQAACSAAKLRADLESKGIGIGPMDTLIAGHALTSGSTLITNNSGEFERVPGLHIGDWSAADYSR